MNKERIKKITAIAIFSAIVIVLQILASYINFGGFPITLTLIPIVISAAVYGTSVSTFLGFVFSLVVFVNMLIGNDPNTMTMFVFNPLATIATIFVKGIAAGYICSLPYKFINNDKLAVIISGISAPVSNTLICYIFLVIFFNTTFSQMIGALLSINFAIELIVNCVLAPSLYTLIKANKKRYTN